MLSPGIADARESLHGDVGRERSTFAQEVSGFSLVLGGPLFQLPRKFHLEENLMQLLHRRVIASAGKVRDSISVALHERQHHGGVQDLC